MATKTDKKNAIRQGIVDSAVIYSQNLKDFYKNAKRAKLTNSQFYFDARHPYANAKKKLPCLKRLPELTSNIICILKDMRTVTIIYKLSVTNLEFTLGLTENIDSKSHCNKFFCDFYRLLCFAALFSFEYALVVIPDGFFSGFVFHAFLLILADDL